MNNLNKKEKTKDIILNEAMKIAHAEGLSKISMRKIANNCDIGLGTIYNYYPTKDDIILDLVEGFWKTCFKGVSDLKHDDMDFFKYIENIYFHILNYLNKFKMHCMEYISELPISSKNKGKCKEAEFIDNLVGMFANIYNEHKSEFRENISNDFTDEDISRFIIDNMFCMLKRFESDYSFFDCIIKRLLL